jgi:hypothetical protein
MPDVRMLDVRVLMLLGGAVPEGGLSGEYSFSLRPLRFFAPVRETAFP